MKKKLAAILMASVMALSLVACGGGDKTAPAQEDAVSTESEEESEFTEEQAELAQEYLDMCEAYDEAVDLVNATPELLEVQELVDVMNELTAVIDEADECFADPELLTEETMEGLKASFAETYKFIDEVTALAGTMSGSEKIMDVDALAEVLTIGYCGADTEDNTYYFVCDESVAFGGIVILSANTEESVNVVGDIVDNGDGSITINDETGYTITFFVEEADGGVILTLQDGTEVAMGSYDAKEVLDMMFIIDEETTILN